MHPPHTQNVECRHRLNLPIYPGLLIFLRFPDFQFLKSMMKFRVIIIFSKLHYIMQHSLEFLTYAEISLFLHGKYMSCLDQLQYSMIICWTCLLSVILEHIAKFVTNGSQYFCEYCCSRWHTFKSSCHPGICINFGNYADDQVLMKAAISTYEMQGFFFFFSVYTKRSQDDNCVDVVWVRKFTLGMIYINNDNAFIISQQHHQWLLQMNTNYCRTNIAGFRLTCRLPHCRFDDDICSTAQASLAAEGWPSGKQRQANRSITLPLCPPRQIADSWILFNSGAIAARWKAKAALPLRAATLKQQAIPSGVAAKRRAASSVWNQHKCVNYSEK